MKPTEKSYNLACTKTRLLTLQNQENARLSPGPIPSLESGHKTTFVAQHFMRKISHVLFAKQESVQI